MLQRLRKRWTKIVAWFDMTPCPKEQMGYTCRHREGECGEWPKNTAKTAE